MITTHTHTHTNTHESIIKYYLTLRRFPFTSLYGTTLSNLDCKESIIGPKRGVITRAGS